MFRMDDEESKTPEAKIKLIEAKIDETLKVSKRRRKPSLIIFFIVPPYFIPEWLMVFMTLDCKRIKMSKLGRNMINPAAAAIPTPAMELEALVRELK